MLRETCHAHGRAPGSMPGGATLDPTAQGGAPVALACADPIEEITMNIGSRRIARTSLVAAAVAAAFGTSTAQQRNPERNAYFGETHVHTSWSLDAWLLNNRVTGPADAY